jgi:hypothetical protein
MVRDLDKVWFTIYGLAERNPFAIRYVGCTCMRITQRLRGHRNSAASVMVRDWIESLPLPGPLVVFLGEAQGYSWALDLEERTIHELLANGANLLNVQSCPNTGSRLRVAVAAARKRQKDRLENWREFRLLQNRGTNA